MQNVHILKSRFLLVLLVAGTLSSPSMAQDAFMIQQGVFSNLMLQPSVDRMLAKNMELARGTQGFTRIVPPVAKAPQSTVFTPAAKESEAILRMTSTYPPENQAQAARTFRELLEKYHGIEDQFGIPRYDVAGAMAALIVGSYMAFTNTDFPDENFRPLVIQMRGVLVQNPDFAAASDAVRQDMYEHFAVLGMLMAGTQMALKEKPDIDGHELTRKRMREAGQAYIENFLKTPITRVAITARGLELR